MDVRTEERTHKVRVQISGDTMHSGRLLYDPLKEFCQGRNVTLSLSMDTNWGSANPDGTVQASQGEYSKPN